MEHPDLESTTYTYMACPVCGDSPMYAEDIRRFRCLFCSAEVVTSSDGGIVLFTSGDSLSPLSSGDTVPPDTKIN